MTLKDRIRNLRHWYIMESESINIVLGFLILIASIGLMCGILQTE